MQTFVIRRRGVWTSDAEWRDSIARSQRVCREKMGSKLRWMRSYLVREADGTLGSVCLCRAVSANAVREHAARSGLPIDELRALPTLDDDAAPTVTGRAA